MWFTNDERALVLNKTNNRALRGAFGDNTAGWDWQSLIAVFPTMVDIRGKSGPALRVRIFAAEAGLRPRHHQYRPALTVRKWCGSSCTTGGDADCCGSGART